MRWIFASVVAVLSAPAQAHLGEVFFLGPEDDWCAAIQSALAGDLFLMSPGEYDGPCDIEGQPEMYAGQITMIESLDPQNPAVFNHDGVSDYIFRFTGDGVSLRYVDLMGTPSGAAAVELMGNKHQIRGSVVGQHSGTAFRVSGDVDDLVLLENTVVDNLGTAFELGCDGCAVTNVEVMASLILNADVGLWVSGQTNLLVRDNFIDAMTTAVSATFADAPVSLVESNYLLSPAGTGLELSGGTYELRNNIVSAGTAATVIGPATDALWVGNTLFGTQAMGLTDFGAGRSSNNAVHPAANWPAGVDGGGNTDCEDPASCWTDAGGQDFWPNEGSVLISSGVESVSVELSSDWCGVPRSSIPTSGALEAIGPVGFGPIEMIGRFEMDCTIPDVPDETGSTEPTEPYEPPATTQPPTTPTTSLAKEPSGCSQGGGGASPHGPTGGGLALLFLLSLRRWQS